MGLYQFFSSLWTSTSASGDNGGGTVSTQSPAKDITEGGSGGGVVVEEHASVLFIQAEGDGPKDKSDSILDSVKTEQAHGQHDPIPRSDQAENVCPEGEGPNSTDDPQLEGAEAEQVQEQTENDEKVETDTEREVHDYYTEAVTCLKTGKHIEAYIFANEALLTDPVDRRAAILFLHSLYKLHPGKLMLDKSSRLHEQAMECARRKEWAESLNLLSLAKKWHCTMGILLAEGQIHAGLQRFDLQYICVAEAMTMTAEDCVHGMAVLLEGSLRHLGHKVQTVTENGTRQLDYVMNRIAEMPTHYRALNWPRGVRLESLVVFLDEQKSGFAVATKMDGVDLRPMVPIDQLARFLNNHVEGTVNQLKFFLGQATEMERELPQILSEVDKTRFRSSGVMMHGFFRHLQWTPTVKQLFDGRVMRARNFEFIYFQLPEGATANAFLKLPAIRDCETLTFYLHDLSPTPSYHNMTDILFSAGSLVAWLKSKDEGGCFLKLPCEYLAGGIKCFLDSLKKDFVSAIHKNRYSVVVNCPNTNVVGVVREETLHNSIGEELTIDVVEDPSATCVMGREFNSVLVQRVPHVVPVIDIDDDGDD